MTDDKQKSRSMQTPGAQGWRALLMPSAVVALCLISLLSGITSWWPSDESNVVGAKKSTQTGSASKDIRQSAELNGIDDFIQIPHNTALDPGAGSFSIQAWIKTTKSTGTQVIVSKYECGQFCPTNVANSAYILSLVEGRLSAYLRDSDAGGPAAFRGGQSLAGRRLIADGKFHHVVLVRDMATGQLRLYIDGILEARAALNAGASGVIKDNDGEADPLMIGASVVAGRNQKTNFFAGIVDEVAVHNRALSVSEIQALFTSNAAGVCRYPIGGCR